MNTTEREGAVRFSQPVRQITIMTLVVALFAAGSYVAYPRVSTVFLANPWLNGLIGVVFVIGVITCFAQVFQLSTSVSWIEGFAKERPGHKITVAPRLLAPLAALLRSRGANRSISSTSGRSILDSVASRLDEMRDITRYITNLLIFLGLLGTFFGLATTVPAVVDTIRSLAPAEGDTSLSVFDRLMSGLEAQLGGMGTAFSSSLLGLAGSLVVGLLELFAGHGQNRFYRELEEWLSTITRIGYSAGDGEGEGQGGLDSNLVIEVLDHFAAQMETLQGIVANAENGRADLDARLATLTAAVQALSDVQAGEASRLGPLAEAHERLIAATTANAEALDRLAAGQGRMAEAVEALKPPESGPPDAEARMRLRSIDVQLLRILEELSAGRQESIADLRHDIATLTGAIRGLGRGAPSAGPGGQAAGGPVRRG